LDSNDVEYRKNLRDTNIFRTATPTKYIADSRAWYVAATHAINKRLELGVYHSRYFTDTRKNTDPPSAHEYDTAISGRFNVNSHWYMKVEGHFINGAPITTPAARGFYLLSNPGGILPATRLLILRSGFAF
jgi:hypothetical protein